MKDVNDYHRAHGHPPNEADDVTPEPEPEVAEPESWDAHRLDLADAFTRAAPERDWILRWPDGDGCLAKGIVGVLSGQGGVGKTRSLIELALAVATGLPWLAPARSSAGGFWTPRGGRKVLAIFAEESAQDLHERVRWASTDLDLGPRGEATVAENVQILGLGGTPVDPNLVRWNRHAEHLATTNAYATVQRLIEQHEPDLVILDPLVDFACSDAETINAVANGFQRHVLELAVASGATVLLAHHINQSAAATGDDGLGAARGVTGLVNKPRWVAVLRPDDAVTPFHKPSDLYRLRVAKANGARTGLEFLEADPSRKGRLSVTSRRPEPKGKGKPTAASGANGADNGANGHRRGVSLDDQ